MNKSTKLIVAAIGLGGLGYFLYKRGLFTNKAANNVQVAKKTEEAVVDTGKKTAVEPPEEVITVSKPLPQQPAPSEPVYTPIWKEEIIYPKDELYPVEQKIVANPTYNPNLYDSIGFKDNTYYDQPYRIDYTTGKYNQDVTFDYLDKDIVNIRLNQLLYA